MKIAKTMGLALVLGANCVHATDVIKDHWQKEVAVYEKENTHRRVITYYDTYVRKDYCLEAGTQYWFKYWNDLVLNSQYDIIVICKSKKNNYDFVEVKCDKNMICNV